MAKTRNLSKDKTIFEAKFPMWEIKEFEKVDQIRFLDRYGKLRLTFKKESFSESSIKNEGENT